MILQEELRTIDYPAQILSALNSSAKIALPNCYVDEIQKCINDNVFKIVFSQNEDEKTVATHRICDYLLRLSRCHAIDCPKTLMSCFIFMFCDNFLFEHSKYVAIAEKRLTPWYE